MQGPGLNLPSRELLHAVTDLGGIHESNESAPPAESSPTWIRETIANAVAIQKGPQREWSELRTAAQQLSALGGSDAWRAALDVLPRDEDILLRAFAARDDPSALCDLLKSRIPLAEQSVSFQSLQRTVQVCAQAHLPQGPLPRLERKALPLSNGNTWTASGTIMRRPPRAPPPR